MSGNLQSDYYIDNLLTRMKAMERRIAALERRGGRASGAAPTATGAAPDEALPAATSIPPLYVVERTTGYLYQLWARRMGGRVKLRLRRVGPTRGES